MFTIECKVVINVCKRSPISFKHVPFCCLLFDSHQNHIPTKCRGPIKKMSHLRPINLIDLIVEGNTVEWKEALEHVITEFWVSLSYASCHDFAFAQRKKTMFSSCKNRKLQWFPTQFQVNKGRMGLKWLVFFPKYSNVPRILHETHV